MATTGRHVLKFWNKFLEVHNAEQLISGTTDVLLLGPCMHTCAVYRLQADTAAALVPARRRW